MQAELDRGIVIGQHDWWRACSDLDMPGYNPFDAGRLQLQPHA